MYGKSILVKGTWNGAPFVCWTDEENEVEIDFGDEGITVEGSPEDNCIFHVHRPVSQIDFLIAINGNCDDRNQIRTEGCGRDSNLFITHKGGDQENVQEG